MDSLRTPVSDASGDVVKSRFIEFLQKYSANCSEVDNLTNQQKLMIDYMTQILTMIQNNKSTVYVDYTHILDTDNELAEAIELEYYRFEPFLRAAIQDIVTLTSQHYVYDVDKGQREFFVAFYNMPNLCTIRQVKTDCIGKLVAISGTVTRSSEVRPELLYGTFTCFSCGTMYSNVEQQFQYTEPKVCKNSECGSQSRFNLLMDKSAFVDWQRLRVQENADEIPPGSMPRCIDVICRNEIVELAKAGDKVIFVGSVAVSPDATGLARAGESSVAGKAGRRANDDSSGISGLKQYGVRELTYKIFFNACSIQPAVGNNTQRIVVNASSETGMPAATLAAVLPLTEGIASGEEGEIRRTWLRTLQKQSLQIFTRCVMIIRTCITRWLNQYVLKCGAIRRSREESS
jgi:DNA replication licensing factor MCM6